MPTTPELVAAVHGERMRMIDQDRLARLATCYRACCNPSMLDRLARTLRGTPATC